MSLTNQGAGNETGGDAATDSYTSELDGYMFEDLEVGMTAIYSRTVTESDIVLFCGISGDTNPIHLNKEYAARTRFGGIIAHGMLSASLISTVLGTKLPGLGAIYISQNCLFRAPVRAGDTVVARATVTELVAEKTRAKLATTCTVAGRVVIDGEAVMLVPSRDE